MASFNNLTMSLIVFVCMLGCTQSFILKVYLVQHPRTVEETEDITCWTCPGKSDNEECNDWAPDRQCTIGHSWCKTVHRLNFRTGESLLVNKECTKPEHCTANHVGCHSTQENDVVDCTSCCNHDLCNEYVAVNHTSAIELSSYTELSAGHSSRSSYTILMIATVAVLTIQMVLS